jgi:rod shape-determining protein MreD
LVAGDILLGGIRVVRAALLVALAALLEAALSPLLTFGWIGPKFIVLGVVVAAMALRDLQALLLGFFGGVLVDALGGGLFGVGALVGIFAAAASTRIGALHRKGEARAFIAQAVGVAVAAYDMLALVASVLSGSGGPPAINYLLGGVVPDVLLNALFAYLVGGRLLKLIATEEERWI